MNDRVDSPINGRHDHEMENSEDEMEGMKAVDNPSRPWMTARSKSVKIAKSIAQRHPNIMAILCLIVLPMLFLLAVSFLCGFILATLEKPQEIDSNHGSLSQRYILTGNILSVQNNTAEGYEQCFANYTAPEGSILNTTDITLHMGTCLVPFEEQTNTTFNNLIDLIFTPDGTGQLSFHWMTCATRDELKTGPTYGLSPHDIESLHVLTAFDKSFKTLREKYREDNMSEEKAFSLAVENANGHDNCRVHTSGGAIFWFTIMTTIGYGNTAPTTTGGQVLIYFIGFLSIIFFTGVTGQAAFVSLVLFDRFASIHAPRLARDREGGIFWLCCYVLWNFIIGVIFYATGFFTDFTLADGFWFAFITTTTVGLGDIHIPHSSVHWYDSLWIPSVMLIGFVLLANFALKFSSWIISLIPPEAFQVKEAFERFGNVDDIGTGKEGKKIKFDEDGFDKQEQEKDPNLYGAIGGKIGMKENPRLFDEVEA